MADQFEFRLRGNLYAGTLAECSRQYEAVRDASRAGASTFPTPKLFRSGCGKPCARFSYNGRIWPDEPWREGLVPLYDNRKAEA